MMRLGVRKGFAQGDVSFTKSGLARVLEKFGHSGFSEAGEGKKQGSRPRPSSPPAGTRLPPLNVPAAAKARFDSALLVD